MTEFLDRYCERTSAVFWSEPFNIISNIAFIIVGFIVLRMYLSATTAEHLKLQNRGRHWDILLLTLLIFLIGIGSALWHILALAWALLADQLPILLFINLYLLSCLYRILRFSPRIILVTFAVYQGFNFSLQYALPSGFLNGSIFYLPTWAFLILIIYILKKTSYPGLKLFIQGGMAFTVALIFRTVDQDICNSFSIGTHFIWHILIAGVIYYLMAALIITLKNRPAPSG